MENLSASPPLPRHPQLHKYDTSEVMVHCVLIAALGNLSILSLWSGMKRRLHGLNTWSYRKNMLGPVSAITAYMTHLFNSIGVAHCCFKVLHP